MKLGKKMKEVEMEIEAEVESAEYFPTLWIEGAEEMKLPKGEFYAKVKLRTKATRKNHETGECSYEFDVMELEPMVEKAKPKEFMEAIDEALMEYDS